MEALARDLGVLAPKTCSVSPIKRKSATKAVESDSTQKATSKETGSSELHNV